MKRTSLLCAALLTLGSTGSAAERAGADPLYVHLKKAATGLLGSEAIKWNFTKFLVDRTGKVIARYAPATKPADLAPDIEKALTAKGLEQH